MTPTGITSHGAPPPITNAPPQDGAKQQAALNAQTDKILSALTIETVEGQGIKAGGRLTLSEIFSLVELDSPTMSTNEIISSLRDLRRTLSVVRSEVEKQIVNDRQNRLEDQHQKNIEKAKKIQEQLDKAEKKGLVGKILGWIGAAITLVAATIATVVTAGATAPLLAMAVVGVGMMVMQETGAMDKVMEGLTEGFADMLVEMGVDADKAQEIGGYMAAAAVAVVIIAANIGATIASGGSNLGSVAQSVLQIIRIVQNVAEAATLATQGGVDIAAGIDTKNALEAQAEKQEIHSTITKLTEAQNMSINDLKRIAEYLKKLDESIAKILAEIAAGQEKIIQNMTI